MDSGKGVVEKRFEIGDISEKVVSVLLSMVFGFLVYRNIFPEYWQADSPLAAALVQLLLMSGFFGLCSLVVSGIHGKSSPSPGSFRGFVERHALILLSLSIALPVIIFNLVHVFGPEYLLADDPSGYYTGINNIARLWLWKQAFLLNAFTETFSWWMMSHFSPYVVRLLYLLIYLTGISFCVYWIAGKIFNLRREEAYLSALIPAVLPLQFQIIAGVNMSYTLLGQFLVLLSLITGFCYLTRKDHSWLLLGLAGLLYTAATRQMEQAVFVSAAVVFIYLAVSGNVLRKTGLILPVAVSSAAVLHRMLTAPRGAAEIQEILLGEMIHRLKIFILYLSPWISPVHREYAIPVVAVLILAGIAGFYFHSDLRSRAAGADHFSRLPEVVRIFMLPGFALLWTIPSIFPFIALNKHMDARTMHLSGYGPWLLIAPGLFFFLAFFISLLRSRAGQSTRIFVVVFIVFLSGLQHMRYAAGSYEKGNYFIRGISRSISMFSFSEGSQIAIVDADTGTHNSYRPCTGYLARILGNRTDIGGIVGPEHFFYDPFAQHDLWKRPMTGLQGLDNLHLFRFLPGIDHSSQPGRSSLEEFRFFLRVMTGESEREPGQQTGDWILYRLDSGSAASAAYTGHGLEEYMELLESLKAEDVKSAQICWGDPRDEPGCNSPLLD